MPPTGRSRTPMSYIAEHRNSCPITSHRSPSFGGRSGGRTVSVKVETPARAIAYPKAQLIPPLPFPNACIGSEKRPPPGGLFAQERLHARDDAVAFQLPGLRTKAAYKRDNRRVLGTGPEHPSQSDPGDTTWSRYRFSTLPLSAREQRL